MIAAAINQRTAAVLVAGALFLLILELVRRRRLLERYALLWLFATALMLVMAAWETPLTSLASLVGIYYPPSALFALAFCFVLALLVHFSLAVSRLSDQSKLLAQRLGLLQRRLEDYERRFGGDVDPERPPDPSHQTELPVPLR